jgi:diguanylate cyclase (GGDEF)-like protein/PAS domain S-box-containing protein
VQGNRATTRRLTEKSSTALNRRRCRDDDLRVVHDALDPSTTEFELEVLSLAVDTAEALIAVISPGGRLLRVNPAGCRFLGYPAEELVGRNATEFMAPDEVDCVVEEHRQLLSSSGPTWRVRRWITSDGDERWISMTRTAVRGPAGEVRCIVATGVDVTGERRAMAALSASEQRHQDSLSAAEERFQQAFAKAPTGIAIVGADGRFLEVNRALAQILGREPAELVQLSFQDITHPDDLEADLDYLAQLLDGTIPGYRMEKRYLRPDGTVVWGLLNVSLLRGADGQTPHLLSHIEDITARKSRNEELDRLAHHDGLTGLANRSTVHRRVDEALARRHLHDVGVLFLDLDDFKAVNDTYGHDVGDRVLSIVGRRLADVVRPGDMVGRVGGDEFVVVCEPANPDVVQSIARRVTAELERPIELAGLPTVHTGATVGAVLADISDDTASVLRRADSEMYRGKALRRSARSAASV